MSTFKITIAEEQKSILRDALEQLRETQSLQFEMVELANPAPDNDDAQDPGEETNNQVAQHPAQNSEVTEEAEGPEEIAHKITGWLERKGVARSDFAKYINRSKSTFTDMLKRPPATLPKGAGKEPWTKIRDFIQNETTQRSFLDSFGGKRRSKATGCNTTRNTHR